MSKHALLSIVCFAMVFMSSAQDYIPVKVLPSEIFKTVKKDQNDTAKWTWKRGGMVNLNVAQGSLSNWASGGDNFTIAVASYLNYHILNKGPKHNWDNSADFNFGYINTTSLGSRKNDDRLDVLSKYGYSIDSTGKWYLSALFNFRSQFFDGNSYSNNVATLNSTLLSPAYLFLAAGFDFKPYKHYSLFFSPVTERMTIVASKRLSDKGLYGVPAGSHSINQIGAFASTTFTSPVFKNVVYKGKMDLFSDYGHNPENVDMYFTNFFNFKINKFLSATYNLDLIYDDDVKLFGKNSDSPGLQLKSLIGIGFSMPFNVIMN
ncbi:DUF3078 domain-containing protein [Limnovirga soli]|uniref:DUF3078 domain-containing protein n=1 Tax=Limnovirga soli TaxID=2656915 RepID=A0A8J8FDH8_9BACT|nr:DUF3078 domain-containing protein [Limnovirga soli]NNV55720.1 DUF3078 domain-containing protein [Limnovirga soli]